MNTQTITARRYVIREPLLIARDAPDDFISTLPNDSSENIWFKNSEREVTADSSSVLERYYNDVYKLLLAKLVDFDRAVAVSENENSKLKALIDELIKIKARLGVTIEND